MRLQNFHRNPLEVGTAGRIMIVARSQEQKREEKRKYKIWTSQFAFSIKLFLKRSEMDVALDFVQTCLKSFHIVYIVDFLGFLLNVWSLPLMKLGGFLICLEFLLDYSWWGVANNSISPATADRQLYNLRSYCHKESQIGAGSRIRFLFLMNSEHNPCYEQESSRQGSTKDGRN